MSTQVMSVVIEMVAKQLGVEEKDVTLETIVPDIHSLGMLAAIKLGKIMVIADIQHQYTVEEAIIELEA